MATVTVVREAGGWNRAGVHSHVCVVCPHCACDHEPPPFYLFAVTPTLAFHWYAVQYRSTGLHQTIRADIMVC